MQCSVFIATSLDGFIARANGDIDWLPLPTTKEDYGYGAFVPSRCRPPCLRWFAT